jgi:hypothetical protein
VGGDYRGKEISQQSIGVGVILTWRVKNYPTYFDPGNIPGITRKDIIMKRNLVKLLVVLALGAFICLPGMANAYFIETFDSNNSGFNTATISNGGLNPDTSALWTSSGGNPDGHIYAGVDNTANRRYAFAQYPTTAIYGDLNGAYLTTDFKIEGTITSTSPLVRFYVGSYTGGNKYYMSNDAFSWDPNNDTSWTAHSIQVLASNFIEWPNQNTGSQTFAQVMADYDDIGLVFADGAANFGNNAYLGFSSSGGATLRVDNFGSSAVPLPGAVLLLGAGLSRLAVYARRRREEQA